MLADDGMTVSVASVPVARQARAPDTFGRAFGFRDYRRAPNR